MNDLDVRARPDLGTNERKRWRRAVELPSPSSSSIGCSVALLGYVGLAIAFFAVTRNVLFLVLGLPGLVALGYLALERIRVRRLLAEVRRTYDPRGVRCLIIHSNSALWEAHVQAQWLPRLGPMADTLNWSERASWPESLAVRVFRRFCLQRRNFNPAIIVFRGVAAPLVFRFFHAFQEARSGRPQYLSALESQAFEALGVRVAP
jgi:hypothetical protein